MQSSGKAVRPLIYFAVHFCQRPDESATIAVVGNNNNNDDDDKQWLLGCKAGRRRGTESAAFLLSSRLRRRRPDCKRSTKMVRFVYYSSRRCRKYLSYIACGHTGSSNYSFVMRRTRLDRTTLAASVRKLKGSNNWPALSMHIHVHIIYVNPTTILFSNRRIEKNL